MPRGVPRPKRTPEFEIIPMVEHVPPIRVEATPDPNVRKFLIHRIINPMKPKAYYKPEDADDDLSRQLFAIDGVSGFFVVNDFVSVCRRGGPDWDALTPRIEVVLAPLQSSRVHSIDATDAQSTDGALNETTPTSEDAGVE
jgi:hypothetical protein